MLKILVLCTGNSCRSIMAEGLFNYYGSGRVTAFSAGSFPTGTVNPLSIATLKRHGINGKGYRSKSWEEFQNQDIDIIITVCDNAAGEACPIMPIKSIKAHWGVSDPAHFQGTGAEVEAEFECVFSILENRVKALFLLPLERMNKEELQEQLNEIGKL